MSRIEKRRIEIRKRKKWWGKLKEGLEWKAMVRRQERGKRAGYRRKREKGRKNVKEVTKKEMEIYKGLKEAEEMGKLPGLKRVGYRGGYTRKEGKVVKVSGIGGRLEGKKENGSRWRWASSSMSSRSSRWAWRREEIRKRHGKRPEEGLKIMRKGYGSKWKVGEYYESYTRRSREVKVGIGKRNKRRYGKRREKMEGRGRSNDEMTKMLYAQTGKRGVRMRSKKRREYRLSGMRRGRSYERLPRKKRGEEKRVEKGLKGNEMNVGEYREYMLTVDEKHGEEYRKEKGEFERRRKKKGKGGEERGWWRRKNWTKGERKKKRKKLKRKKKRRWNRSRGLEREKRKRKKEKKVEMKAGRRREKWGEEHGNVLRIKSRKVKEEIKKGEKVKLERQAVENARRPHRTMRKRESGRRYHARVGLNKLGIKEKDRSWLGRQPKKMNREKGLEEKKGGKRARKRYGRWVRRPGKEREGKEKNVLTTSGWDPKRGHWCVTLKGVKVKNHREMRETVEKRKREKELKGMTGTWHSKRNWEKKGIEKDRRNRRNEGNKGLREKENWVSVDERIRYSPGRKVVWMLDKWRNKEEKSKRRMRKWWRVTPMTVERRIRTWDDGRRKVSYDIRLAGSLNKGVRGERRKEIDNPRGYGKKKKKGLRYGVVREEALTRRVSVYGNNEKKGWRNRKKRKKQKGKGGNGGNGGKKEEKKRKWYEITEETW